jgi:ABC-2 type transport system permease protein
MPLMKPISAAQLRAIIFLRARLFINSLRSVRHKLNLVSRIIGGVLVVAAGLGGGFAIAMTCWGFTKAARPEFVSLVCWAILLFWQLFPIMASAFNQNLDASDLLRFPLSYRTYFVVRLLYGALDIPTALGLSWSTGVFLGVLAGNVDLGFWALVSVAIFVAFNILLARAVYVWIERWLLRRRSREIMGLLFFLTLIGFQLIGPALGKFGGSASHGLHLPPALLSIQQMFPPGLFGLALAQASHHWYALATRSLAFMGAFAVAAFGLLHLRLRTQYRGESPSEGERRDEQSSRASVKRGWRIPAVRTPITAVYEKEIRYFSRSGPLLFTLIMPLVVVLVLWGGQKGFLTHQAGYALPVGAAYCLLLLTNIVYNSFGADAGGFQFFLSSPVPFRQIAAAKNLAQLTVLAVDLSILWIGICLVYEPPNFRIIALTFAWYLFAIPLNLALGNLLSLYTPKRIDYATFGRQRPSESTILISLLVQMGSVALGGVAIAVARVRSNLWIATVSFLILALPALTVYFVLLWRLDRIVMRRREVLATELCRA